MAEANPPADRKRIAVVAVHGVADQAPDDSAEAIANLLLNLNRDGHHTRYVPFTRRPITIATRPVLMRPLEAESPRLNRFFSRFDPKGPALRYEAEAADAVRQGRASRRRGVTPTPPEHVFMRDQLGHFKGDGPAGAYETVRLESMRLGDGGGDDGEVPVHVHVYEMYWADLSKLGTGIMRMVGELYQLMCHLSHLGRHAVDLATLEYDTPAWRAFQFLQTAAVAILTLPIVILHLFIFTLGVVPLAASLERPRTPALIGLTLFVGGATAYYAFRRRAPKGPRRGWRVWAWGLAPLAASAVAALTVWLIACAFRWAGWSELGFRHLLTIEWIAILVLVATVMLTGYARRQRRAGTVGLVLGTIVLGLLLPVILLAPNSHAGIARACLWVIELTFLMLVVCWTAFVVAQLAAAVAGYVVKRAAPDDERRRVHRTVWTARLTLAFPIAVLVLLGIIIGAVLRHLPLPLIPARQTYHSLFVPPLGAYASGYEFGDYLLELSSTHLFPVFLLLLALAGIFAAWALFPVVWAEAKPPVGGVEMSRQFGNWLDNGYLLLGRAGHIVFVSVVLLLPLSAAFTWLETLGWPPAAKLYVWLGNHGLNYLQTRAVLGSIGTLVATPAVILVLLQNKKLTLGFRAVLDIALDVDNHLRVRPLDRNPKAQIAARYASLLRYLCRWTDPEDGGRYDAVVIIAHSQGTVITADLLRFIRYEWQQGCTDPSLDRIFGEHADLPVLLFTMGCPLRQLYGIRFPHLYRWARHDRPDAVPIDNPFDDSADAMHQRRAPLPQPLGVACWVNAYRSGDYVGRFLWQADQCTHVWDFREDKTSAGAWTATTSDPSPLTGDVGKVRREFCIGPGAHTHYWDGTAKPIAVQLDRLIDEAARATPAPAA